MFAEIVRYAKDLGDLGSWSMAKLEADAARNTYLKSARSGGSKRAKKPNRLHVSKKARRKHKGA